MKLTDKERADMLTSAARILDNVVSSLNTKFQACPHCRAKHFDRFDHHKAELSLSSAKRKIEEMRQLFSTPSASPQGFGLAEDRKPEKKTRK